MIHRDLKPENILMKDMAEGADIRINDFWNLKYWNKVKLLKTFLEFIYKALEQLIGMEYKNFSYVRNIWSKRVITYLLLALTSSSLQKNINLKYYLKAIQSLN